MSYRMRRREFLATSGQAALGFSLPPLAARAQANQIPAESKLLIADLEKQILQLMKEARIPGVSVAIIKDAKLLWRRGFGVKDIASKVPVDDKTVFEAASVSKTVFAYVVMKLREKGIMDLDTPLTKYTPERFLDGDPRLDLITARRHGGGNPGFSCFVAASVERKSGYVIMTNSEHNGYSGLIAKLITGDILPQFLGGKLRGSSE